LNALQDLCALTDGIVIRKKNLDFYPELAGSLFGRLRLLDLIIIIAGRE
jgi:hypothetical protein